MLRPCMASSGLLAYEGRLDGHRAGITALSFSEDGKKLLTASNDRTLRVWEVRDDTEVTADGSFKKGPVASTKRTLRGHSDVVSQAILERGGNFVLSSSWDRTVKLWTLDEEDDEPCIRTFRGHEHQVNAVVWSPDHRIILTASCDRTIKVWNNLGECKFTIGYDECHKDWVTAVVWGDKAESLLSASWDKTVKLWDAKNMKMLWETRAHTAPVLAVAVSPDGSIGASGGADRTILLLDLKGRCVDYAFRVDGIIRGLDFNPLELRLAAITEMSPSGRVVQVFDLSTKTCLQSLSPPGEGLAGLAVKWDPQGRRLFGGFSDGSLHVWRSR